MFVNILSPVIDCEVDVSTKVILISIICDEGKLICVLNVLTLETSSLIVRLIKFNIFFIVADRFIFKLPTL